MKRELRLTNDGSHTFYVPELDEPYHSIHGAIQESLHIFIGQGFCYLSHRSLSILEIGFGTGLNALLSLAEAEKRGVEVQYHGIEKYPINYEEYSSLNYEKIIEGIPPGSLMKLHQGTWGEADRITDNFTLTKEMADIRTINPKGPFDLVYFDAFAPQKQADLWSEEVFCNIYKALKTGGILVTYTSMGIVKRALRSCGFSVKRAPGPPGKRHTLRATKR